MSGVGQHKNSRSGGLGVGRRTTTLVVIICVAILGCSKNDQTAAQPPVGMALPVSVIEVRPTSVPISAETVAQTEGAKEVEIRPRVGGILLRRLYEEGSAVKAGQPMFLIDPVPYQNALAQAKAQFEQQKARVVQTEREEKRLHVLLETQAISQREYDNAVSENAIALAALQQAEVRVRDAALNLSYTHVTAPVSGISGRFRFSEGALVEAYSSLLTTIVQISPIWVRFSLSDNELAQLGGPLNEQRVQQITLRATFDNSDQRLLPGQFVRARVVTGEQDGVYLVPQVAVQVSDMGKTVYVVNEKNEATVRPVVTGRWVGKDWVILEGLKAGDKVIVDNLIKLRPGTLVAPHPVGESPAGPPPQPGPQTQT